MAPILYSELSEPELLAAARALGEHLQPGDVVLLTGPMGAGKTTWTRALAEGLGVRRPDRVRSPTFNICLQHDGPRPLMHVDLFRLAETGGDAHAQASTASVGAAAFEALGLPALVEGDADFVLVVEWGELWRDPPPERLEIELAVAGEGRRVAVRAFGERPAARLAAWSAAVPIPPAARGGRNSGGWGP